MRSRPSAWSLLLDEVECHLHPKWQRTTLPALLTVVRRLSERMQVQVMRDAFASCARVTGTVLRQGSRSAVLVRPRRDEVHFRVYPWAKQGDVVNWLTSDIFGLRQARSKEAEQAIEAAEKFMDDEVEGLPEHLHTRVAIQRELRRVLPGDDPFLVRWHLKTEAVPQP